jgi:hypothetical protein
MTRTSRTSLITIAFAIAGCAMLSQGASAAPDTLQCSNVLQMLSNQTSCREQVVRIKKQRRSVQIAFLKEDDGGGNSGGKGGKGGRGK